MHEVSGGGWSAGRIRPCAALPRMIVEPARYAMTGVERTVDDVDERRQIGTCTASVPRQTVVAVLLGVGHMPFNACRAIRFRLSVYSSRSTLPDAIRSNAARSLSRSAVRV